MSSYYENLKKRLGEDGARQHMRELRSNVKNPGFASMDNEKIKSIARKGAAARWQKDGTPQKTETLPETRTKDQTGTD